MQKKENFSFIQLTLFAFILVLLLSFLPYTLHANNTSQAYIKSYLQQSAQNLSRQLPRQIDADTRADSVTALPDGLLHRFTLTRLSRSQLSGRDFGALVKPILKSQICQNPDYKEFWNLGLSSNYEYTTRDGAKLPRVVITPNDCGVRPSVAHAGSFQKADTRSSNLRRSQPQASNDRRSTIQQRTRPVEKNRSQKLSGSNTGMVVIDSLAGITISADSSFKCSESVTLRFDTQAPETYDLYHRAINRLAQKGSYYVVHNCPEARKIDFIAYANKKEFGKTTADKKRGWATARLEKMPPPYEQNIYGYSEVELIQNGDDYKLYRGKALGSSRHAAKSFFMVHNLSFGDKLTEIGEIVQRGRQKFLAYNSDFMRKITSSKPFLNLFESEYTRLKGLTPEYRMLSISINHYANSFQMNDLQAPQIPMITTGVYNQSQDIYSTDFKIRGEVNSLSPKGSCVLAQLKLTGRASREKILDEEYKPISDKCPGTEIGSNPLKSMGFHDSKKVHSGKKYDLYLTYSSPFSKWNETSADPGLALVHRPVGEEKFFEYTHLGNGQYVISDDWLEELDSLESLQQQVSKDNLITVHNYVEGFSHISGPEHPLFTMTLTRNESGRINQAIKFASIDLPPNSVSKLQKAQTATVAQKELAKAAKSRQKTPEEQAILIENLRKESASKHNQAFTGREYWMEFEKEYNRLAGEDPKVITAKKYINGDFVGRDEIKYLDFVRPLFRYVGEFYDRCPQYVNSNFVTVQIPDYRTVEITERNMLGETSTRKEAEKVYRTIKIHPKFSQVISENVQNYLNEVESAGLKPSLNAMFSGKSIAEIRSELREKTISNAESSWSVGWVFEKESCENPALEQLGENLFRAATGKASVQAARLDYKGASTPQTHTVGSPATLIDENDDKAWGSIVSYRYANPPKNWLPGKPKEIWQKTAETYGAVKSSNYQSKVRISADIMIEGAASTSLSAMRIFPVMPIMGGPSRQFSVYLSAALTQGKAYGYNWTAEERKKMKYHILNYSKISPTPMVVECEYRNGSYLAFWLDKQTDANSQETLEKVHPKHPLLGVQPTRQSCPASYEGPQNLWNYLQ